MKIAQRITANTRLTDLINLIEDTHHTFTRAELNRIARLLGEPELDSLSQVGEIRKCFTALHAELESHLAKEENILFPYISKLDDGEPGSACFGSVANPIRVMNAEHLDMIGQLESLRRLTAQYRPAANSNPQTFLLFASLAGLDDDLMEHMYWEDQVLFPRALQKERSLLAR
ncbi:MAG TPA: hemerythrin domain-containing protein [Methylophilaceae bacterium]|nr:hemerythrin domain-containing protein [Methylophilaceae bacterium]